LRRDALSSCAAALTHLSTHLRRSDQLPEVNLQRKMVRLAIILAAAWAVAASAAARGGDNPTDAAHAPAGGPRKLLAPSSGYGQLNGGIQYHGGELMTAPLNVHLIYYGTWANYSATSGVLSGLVNSLSGSQYWAINHHYYDANGTRVSLKIRTATQLQVPYLDMQHGGTVVQMPYYDLGARQVLHHVVRDEASLPLSSTSLYVILTSGMRIDGMCTAFCGWHNAVEIAGTMVKVRMHAHACRAAPRNNSHAFAQHQLASCGSARNPRPCVTLARVTLARAHASPNDAARH
jgi:hypothetical protein